MPFAPFPQSLYVKTLNTGVTEKLARFTADKDMLLRYIVLTVLKNGESQGSEQLTLKIYSSWDLDKPILIASNGRNLADIGVANGQSWIGRLRFDFEGSPLTAGDVYYLAISSTNYERTLDFYLGAILDWPYPVYSQIRSIAGAQIRIIGDSERSNDMAVGGEIRQVEVAEGVPITAPTDMTVPAASIAAAARFSGFPGAAPVEEVDTITGAFVMRFADNGTGKAVAFVKVPQGYVTGTQILLYISLYSPSTTNTIKLAATSYLIKKDSTAMESTANSHASTNGALTNATTARKYRQAEIDLTDGNGQINSQDVEAGDTLRVEITRDSATDTDTADIRFVPDLSEVQYNG